MPKKTISVAGKTITVTQLVVAIVLGGFALAGGFFGILQADDRWNQTPTCTQNAGKTEQLEKDMIAGFQQMIYERNVRFEEQRMATLYDQLAQAKVELSKDPNNQVKRDRVYYLIDEIKRTKENLKQLHERRIN